MSFRIKFETENIYSHFIPSWKSANAPFMKGTLNFFDILGRRVTNPRPSRSCHSYRESRNLPETPWASLRAPPRRVDHCANKLQLRRWRRWLLLPYPAFRLRALHGLHHLLQPRPQRYDTSSPLLYHLPSTVFSQLKYRRSLNQPDWSCSPRQYHV